MLNILSSIFKKDEPDKTEINDNALKITKEIERLESELNSNPKNKEIQKKLMLVYNQALKIYAKSTTLKNQIDPLFVKIDDLRNTIRKNF